MKYGSGQPTATFFWSRCANPSMLVETGPSGPAVTRIGSGQYTFEVAVCSGRAEQSGVEPSRLTGKGAGQDMPTTSRLMYVVIWAATFGFVRTKNCEPCVPDSSPPQRPNTMLWSVVMLANTRAISRAASV